MNLPEGSNRMRYKRNTETSYASGYDLPSEVFEDSMTNRDPCESAESSSSDYTPQQRTRTGNSRGDTDVTKMAGEANSFNSDGDEGAGPKEGESDTNNMETTQRERRSSPMQTSHRHTSTNHSFSTPSSPFESSSKVAAKLASSKKGKYRHVRTGVDGDADDTDVIAKGFEISDDEEASSELSDTENPSTTVRRRPKKKLPTKVPEITSTYAEDSPHDFKLASLTQYTSWSERQRLNYQLGVHPDDPKSKKLIRELRKKVNTHASQVGIALNVQKISDYETDDYYTLVRTLEIKFHEEYNIPERLTRRLIQAILDDQWTYNQRLRRIEEERTEAKRLEAKKAAKRTATGQLAPYQSSHSQRPQRKAEDHQPVHASESQTPRRRKRGSAHMEEDFKSQPRRSKPEVYEESSHLPKSATREDRSVKASFQQQKEENRFSNLKDDNLAIDIDAVVQSNAHAIAGKKQKGKNYKETGISSDMLSLTVEPTLVEKQSDISKGNRRRSKNGLNNNMSILPPDETIEQRLSPPKRKLAEEQRPTLISPEKKLRTHQAGNDGDDTDVPMPSSPPVRQSNSFMARTSPHADSNRAALDTATRKDHGHSYSKSNKFTFRIRDGPNVQIKRCGKLETLLTKLEDYFPEGKDDFDIDEDILMVRIESQPSFKAVCSVDDLDIAIFNDARPGDIIHVYIAKYYNEFEEPGFEPDSDSSKMVLSNTDDTTQNNKSEVVLNYQTTSLSQDNSFLLQSNAPQPVRGNKSTSSTVGERWSPASNHLQKVKKSQDISSIPLLPSSRREFLKRPIPLGGECDLGPLSEASRSKQSSNHAQGIYSSKLLSTPVLSNSKQTPASLSGPALTLKEDQKSSNQDVSLQTTCQTNVIGKADKMQTNITEKIDLMSSSRDTLNGVPNTQFAVDNSPLHENDVLSHQGNPGSLSDSQPLSTGTQLALLESTPTPAEKVSIKGAAVAVATQEKSKVPAEPEPDRRRRRNNNVTSYNITAISRNAVRKAQEELERSAKGKSKVGVDKSKKDRNPTGGAK